MRLTKPNVGYLQMQLSLGKENALVKQSCPALVKLVDGCCAGLFHKLLYSSEIAQSTTEK